MTMQVSARDFRSNQGKYLTVANRGHEVTLNSRYGRFRIVPIRDRSESKIDITSDIIEGLKDIKLIREGKLKAKSAKSLLDEL